MRESSYSSSSSTAGATPNRVTAELIERLTTAALSIKERNGFLPFVLVPDGFKMEKLTAEHLDPLPDHIQQRVALISVESYIAYIKKFQTSTTAIFAVANDTGAEFVTIADYHEGGKDGKPLRAAHRVTYSPAYTPEFKAWCEISGKPQTQEQFLDHLRKWGDTITNLSDADLIEMASSLDFQTDGQFSSHVERVKGGRKLLINERVEGSAQLKGKTVTVPEGLVLKLPVFIDGRAYDLGVDLMYRPQNGALRIIAELRRSHLVIRQAIKDVVADVKAGTGIEPFLGRLA